jgi:crotonobetainyl-CoA:carnitine CoA-transferase CaiB-like acyl-CoA transferase
MLIYASGSGFGHKGAESKEPTLDPLGLARSGFLSAFEVPSLPTQYKGLGDQTAAIILSYGILAALVARERLGVGQEVNTSLLGSMIALQSAYMANVCFLGKETPNRSREIAANPLMNHYRCQDGKWLFLSHAQSDRYWSPFCRAIGRDDLETDSRFADAPSRQNNGKELVSILDGIFATRTAKEWMECLKSQGDFLCTPINTITDVINDPQALANDYVVEIDHPTVGKVKTPGFPVDFSKTPVLLPTPAPELGQHTEEVLIELAGYTWADIAELREQEVI